MYNKKKNMPANDLWVYDITVLTRDLTDFWPKRSHDESARLNAWVRFSMYFAIIMSIARKPFLPVLFVFLALVIIFANTRSRTSVAVIVQEPPDEKECTGPTPWNPYSNRLMGESVYKPPVCQTLDHRVSDAEFIRGVPKDMWDAFDRNGSRRQFYTVPNNNIVNDQTGFAMWLYGSDKTCKSPEACVPTEI